MREAKLNTIFSVRARGTAWEPLWSRHQQTLHASERREQPARRFPFPRAPWKPRGGTGRGGTRCTAFQDFPFVPSGRLSASPTLVHVSDTGGAGRPGRTSDPDPSKEPGNTAALNGRPPSRHGGKGREARAPANSRPAAPQAHPLALASDAAVGALAPQPHFPLSQASPTGPELAAYTCPQGTCTGFSYTSRHTGQVKRPRGSASAAGPANCVTPSRGCCCAAILLPRSAAQRQEGAGGRGGKGRGRGGLGARARGGASGREGRGSCL
jgi:hypothetical protein